MDWTNLTSSNIQAVSHDPQTGDLAIQFRNGRRYAYPSVPPTLADKLVQSDSPGSFFHRYIKPNFSGTEVTEE